MCEQKLKQILCIIYSLIKENIHLCSSVLLKESMEKSKRTCLLSNINISCWQKPLRSFRMRIPVKKAAVFRKDWFMKTVSKCSVVKHYCSQWQFFWISFYLKVFHNLTLDSSNSGSKVMESFYNTIPQREEQETRK